MAASHVSAAVLHGLALYHVDLKTVHVTYAPSCLRRGGRHGVRSHDGPWLDHDVTMVDHVPVTTVGRTVIDCSRSLPLEPALVIADYAFHQRLVEASELRDRAAAWSGMNGIDGARAVIQLMDARTESVGETRTRLILVRAGIQVEPQFVIRSQDGSFVARVDFRVKSARVVVEFDGRNKYPMNGDVESAHWREKLRNDKIPAAGYQLVHVYWSDLENPETVVAKVRAAIDRAAHVATVG